MTIALLNDFLGNAIPTRKNEQWKYTDLSFLKTQQFNAAIPASEQAFAELVKAKRLKDKSLLLVFINGYFAEQLSDLAALPKDILCCNINTAKIAHAELLKTYVSKTNDKQTSPFIALNKATATDGLFLYLPKNSLLTMPLHVLFLNTTTAMYTGSRNIIIADTNSQFTLVEEHWGDDACQYFSNSVTEIHAEPNAQIQYHKVQDESALATHIAHLTINQKQDSHIKAYALAIGGQVAREDIIANLQGANAECSANGFYYLQRDGQHIDNHIQINHQVSYTSSEMIYKGMLNKKSRAVFNGKIFVHENAQKTQAHQANHSILLSPEAEVDTKPEFEIYADDVKCVHGATVGQLNEEALFYLQSRGITKADASKILANAFAHEVMDGITQTAIAQHMLDKLGEYLC